MTIRQFLMRLGSQYVRRTGAFLVAAGALVTIFTRGFVLRFACAVVILAVTLAAETGAALPKQLCLRSTRLCRTDEP
jgi:hypothetical protein